MRCRGEDKGALLIVLKKMSTRGEISEIGGGEGGGLRA